MRVSILKVFSYCIVGLAICSVFFGTYKLNKLNATQQQQQRSQIDAFMRKKLDFAKDILEGLTTNDMNQVASSAQGLSALSLESAWNVYTTDEYLTMSEDFRRSLTAVREGARNDNSDRATLGYISMTVQCVECHRFLRDRR
jgi:hypothetical protein